MESRKIVGLIMITGALIFLAISFIAGELDSSLLLYCLVIESVWIFSLLIIGRSIWKQSKKNL